MRRTLLALAVAVAAMVAVSLVGSGTAGAHTESDLVAVPAGSDATVTLQPTHGCAGSPTVQVRIRAEVAGATAGDVDGWTATATQDDGRTVLEWTGGSLPADATGAFPVHFTVPDDPGRLLLFPAIQTCENGDELAWIEGDPDGEYPAPRLLILPAGSQSAATIDDVPADAPGRDQLVAIVDVDNPSATTVPEATSDTATTLEAAEPADTTVPAETAADISDDDDSVLLYVIIGLLALGLIGSFVGLMVIRRGKAIERENGGDPTTR
ncbi:MAG TPA: DUF1775 domain-containing protein [Acidimicrobiales bacterium]|nr:DUF1775 domain-containing protein [Acidimicrobiales bacterium]